MAGTTQVGRQGIARLLMVCAVLTGLFLMHGAPATAAEGCHGVMSAPTAMDGEPAALLASAAHGTREHPGGEPPARVAAPSMAHGAMCVSTPARERTPMPASALLTAVAVSAATVLAGWAVARGRTGRHAPPPPGGRGLLLQVCVARR